MLVGVYSVGPEPSKGYGPHMLSFDHEFLLDPAGPCPDHVKGDHMKEFGYLFMGDSIKNGVKRQLEIGENRESLLSLVSGLESDLEVVGDNRGEIIDNYRIGSPENSHMVRVQDFFGRTINFLRYSEEHNRNLVGITHNNQAGIPGEGNNRGTFPSRGDKFLGTLCYINSAEILTADLKSRTYTGNVSWSDPIERANPTDNFIAHTFPEEVVRHLGKDFFVRNRESNCLTGGYHFTRLPNFDAQISSYIFSLIEEFEAAATTNIAESPQKLIP